MVRGDDEIAALLAEMEQKQYGTVTQQPQEELDQAPVASFVHMQDADTKTLLRAEISRHFAFQEIKAKFDLLCAELAIQPDKAIFIRWLLKMKYLERENTMEPLIPVAPRSTDGHMLDEMKKLGVDKGKINWFTQDLARWAAKSYSKFVHVMEKASVKKIRVKLVEQTDGYVLQCSRSSVNISKDLYKRLRARYSAQNAHFHDRLFLTLMRYKPLQGRILPSLPERCKAVLRKHLSIETECYTTPVLATTERYCSLFVDTDMCFGSLGNFIENLFEEGSFLVHPPLVHEIIDAASDHMQRMLSAATQPMSFAVVIPCWDARGVANIRNSEYARVIIETEFRDNEQARFQRHSGPAPAQLVILQNEAGAATWPVTKQLEEEFLQAYRNKRVRRGSDLSADDEAASRAQDADTAGLVDADAHEAHEDAAATPKPTKNKQKQKQKQKKRKIEIAAADSDQAASAQPQPESDDENTADEDGHGEAAVEHSAMPAAAQHVPAKAKKSNRLSAGGSKKRKPLRQR